MQPRCIFDCNISQSWRFFVCFSRRVHCLPALMKPTRWMIPEYKYINNKQSSLLLQLKFYFKFKFRTPLVYTAVNAPLALHLATFNAFSIWNTELALDNNRTRYVPAKPLRWTQPRTFEVALPFLPLRKRNISAWKGSLAGRDFEPWFAFWVFLQLDFASARRPGWKDLLSAHCTLGNVQFSSCTGQRGTRSRHRTITSSALQGNPTEQSHPRPQKAD